MLEYWSKQHLSIVRSSSIENSIKNQKSTWKGYSFETMYFCPLSQNVFGTSNPDARQFISIMYHCTNIKINDGKSYDDL